MKPRSGSRGGRKGIKRASKSRKSHASPIPNTGALKTLDRVLSKAGLGSRTEARSWIAAGRVSVNGKVILSHEQWVDPNRYSVALDGKRIEAKQKLYLLLYKPKGFITSYGDPEGRPTVYDLIADLGEWVAPVGRLDQDTTGLLILTNDTEFADLIMAPERHVQKKYLVKTSSHLSDPDVERLRTGVDLSDGVTRPAHVERVRDTTSSTVVEITLTEGRNRQVRRMIEAVGSRVRKLVRTAIGPITIGSLEIGKWRELTPKEVTSLRASAAKTRDRVNNLPPR
ncbi:MAG TPA: pseudouridine synthase [Bryobacteraceae bacterium]|nr:pseudouridine synthase [Bryobacteraceae bacterium]